MKRASYCNRFVLEKLDGVRIYWNGKGELSTSTLKRIQPPSWFARHLPKVPIEGELWCGYNTYNTAWQLTFGASKDPTQWVKATFNVFDAPTKNDMKYEERIAEVEKALTPEDPSTRLTKAVTCLGKDHLCMLAPYIYSLLSPRYFVERSAGAQGRRSHTTEAQIILQSEKHIFQSETIR